VARGELAEKGGEVGEWGWELVELRQSVLLRWTEATITETGLGAGGGEGLQGIDHLSGQATASSGAALTLVAQGVALLRPLVGSGEVATGLRDHGQNIVALFGIKKTKGFEDLTSFVGVALGGGEVVEVEMYHCKLALCAGFVRPIAKSLVDPQAFQHRAAGLLEVPRGGELVAPLPGGFTFQLVNDADVLRGNGETGLILQLYSQLARSLIPGPRLSWPACLPLDDAKEVVGPHHLTLIGRISEAIERLAKPAVTRAPRARGCAGQLAVCER